MNFNLNLDIQYVPCAALRGLQEIVSKILRIAITNISP